MSDTGESIGTQLIVWDAEHALDVRSIANTDLNVRFFIEARGIVNAVAFKEDTTDGVKGFLLVAFHDGVDVVDYRTIQVPLQQIVSAPVDWHQGAGSLHIELEIEIGLSY